MVVLVGIGSALFLSLVNVFLKKLFQKISSRELAPLSFFLASVTMLIFSPFYYHFEYTLNTVIILSIIFILDAIANYLYYRAIESYEVSYESVFMSLSPIFTLLVFTLFIDMISLKALISVIGILISVYILNLDHRASILEPFANIFKDKHYLGLLNAVFVGVSAILIKLVFEEGTINPPTLYLFRSIAVFFIISIMLNPRPKKIKAEIIFSAWGRVLFIIGNFLLYLYAISLGNVVVATTVSSIYPAFILIFSYFMFKEKITVEKGISILSILFFIVILNYSI